MTPNRESTTSKEPAPKSWVCASATSHSMAGRSCRSRAALIMAGEMSVPTTRPVSSRPAECPPTSGATRPAARAVVTPDPHPTSSTLIPASRWACSNKASAMGSSCRSRESMSASQTRERSSSQLSSLGARCSAMATLSCRRRFTAVPVEIPVDVTLQHRAYRGNQILGALIYESRQREDVAADQQADDRAGHEPGSPLGLPGSAARSPRTAPTTSRLKNSCSGRDISGSLSAVRAAATRLGCCSESQVSRILATSRGPSVRGRPPSPRR